MVDWVPIGRIQAAAQPRSQGPLTVTCDLLGAERARQAATAQLALSKSPLISGEPLHLDRKRDAWAMRPNQAESFAERIQQLRNRVPVELSRGRTIGLKVHHRRRFPVLGDRKWTNLENFEVSAKSPEYLIGSAIH